MLLVVLGAILAPVALASSPEVYFSQLKSEVRLECDQENVIWKTRSNSTGMEYMDIVQDEGIEEDDNTLVFSSLKEDQLGYYACFDSDDIKIKEYEIAVRFKIKKMLASVSVNKGAETLPDDLSCSTLGTHQVIFRWFKRPEGSDEDSELTQICGIEGDNCRSRLEPSDPLTSELKDDTVVTTPLPFMERISIAASQYDGGYTSTLTISNVQTDDRAVYVCQAVAIESKDDEDLVCSETENCEEVFTLLRVKDPMGAIYPFIGIVAEVVILCLVIFFCERRKKEDDFKEDMDDDRYAGNNVASNNSLRQRK